MEVSEYLSAIQSLEGNTPGAKYKYLHSIAAKIIENDREKEDFIRTGNSSRLHRALLPHLRIIVGIKLKSNESIIEALKSTDITIIKLALSAKWFFDASNPLIDADNFIRNIIPNITLRTRTELIKILAKCLANDSNKANEFFDKFSEIYGIKQSLHLLAACSEDHIYKGILKYKLILPSRIIEKLYLKHPQLIVQYFQLGNSENEKNLSDRKIHSIDLFNYKNTLPILARNYPQEFFELIKTYRSPDPVKIGSTRARFFLKNALNIAIENPKISVSVIPLKKLYHKLSIQQFEYVFRKLMIEDTDSYSLYYNANYLKYYPREKKFNFFRQEFETVSGESLLNDRKNLEYTRSIEFFPNNFKEEIAKRILEPFNPVDSKYWEFVHTLPPKQAIPILKDRIANVSDISRSECLKQMVKSCGRYNSKDDLLEVLNYFDTRHKNELATVQLDFLYTLYVDFEIDNLEKSHWMIIKDIIQRIYVKGDLFAAHDSFQPDKILMPILKFFLEQSDDPDIEDYVNRIVDIILVFYFENNGEWIDIENPMEIREVCLRRFLEIIPQKYPKSHMAWKKMKKVLLPTLLLDKMNEINGQNHKKRRRKRNQSKNADATLKIQNYPWLIDFGMDNLRDEKKKMIYKDRLCYKRFRRVLRKHDPDFYRNLIDKNENLLYDVTFEDAASILKKEPATILLKWKWYLDLCREKLHKNDKSTMWFVLATKWFQELPVKFVKQCLSEIEKQGSMILLGILLEGDILANIIKPVLSQEIIEELDENKAKKAIKKISKLPIAINKANPPVPIDSLLPFCTVKYISLASKSLRCTSRRVPIKQAKDFVNQLMDNENVCVKILAIHVWIQIATCIQKHEILRKNLEATAALEIRSAARKIVINSFHKIPGRDSFESMKVLINNLTSKDGKMINELIYLRNINYSYLSEYIETILKKLDEFSDEEINEEEKSGYIRNLVDNIEEEMAIYLTENLFTNIIQRNVLDHPFNFIFCTYLFSDEEKFYSRLNHFWNVVQEVLKEINLPDSKNHRCYPVSNKFTKFLESAIFFWQFTDKRDLSLQVVNRFLDDPVFTKEMRIYSITLNVYKIYFEESEPKSFGYKCTENVANLVKTFGSEIIIHEYTKALKDLLKWSHFFKVWKKSNLIMTIIEGMIDYDVRLSALIAVKLLYTYDVKEYDGRFDEFIEIWMNSGDVTVCCVIDNFVSEIDSYV